MFQQQINNFTNPNWIYDQVRAWVFIGGVFYTLFKGLNWVKTIRTNDLVHIQAGVEELKKEMTKQTSSFVEAMDKNTREITELRGDMKLIIGSIMGSIPASATVRRKK